MRVLCSPSRYPPLFIASLLCVLAVGGCGKQTPNVGAKSGTDAELPVVQAASLTVEPTAWPLIVRTQGSLVADEIAVVGAKVAGRVADVRVDLGDRVAAQATLATIDQADFQLQVSQAEAQLAQARAALGLEPDAPLESLNPRRAPPVREQEAIWNEAQARSARYQELLAENAVT
ncbi:MAG TPA: biotin/lipoyl-binding protein, partial [Pirellulaceae bacterium]|nr:biotin/lipoyl-binding protein [Pirellulaceae bacterium]